MCGCVIQSRGLAINETFLTLTSKTDDILSKLSIATKIKPNLNKFYDILKIIIS
jgi:hypothetical protein